MPDEPPHPRHVALMTPTEAYLTTVAQGHLSAMGRTDLANLIAGLKLVESPIGLAVNLLMTRPRLRTVLDDLFLSDAMRKVYAELFAGEEPGAVLRLADSPRFDDPFPFPTGSGGS